MSNSLEFLGKAATPLRAAGCNRAVAQSSQWVLILRSRNGGARTKFCLNRFFSEARGRTKRQIAGLENRLSPRFPKSACRRAALSSSSGPKRSAVDRRRNEAAGQIEGARRSAL